MSDRPAAGVWIVWLDRDTVGSIHSTREGAEAAAGGVFTEGPNPGWYVTDDDTWVSSHTLER